MMSKKQWSALLCFHVSYLFLGASIFYHIENPLELANRLAARTERFELLKLIHQHYAPNDHDARKTFVGKLETYCDRTMANTSDSEEPAPIWDFYHSFFFSYTVVSTIGYGNLAPTTSFGRILMIFYGLFGIPINGILFANLGAYFADTFTDLYRRYKEKNPSSGANIDYQMGRFGLLGQIALYLLPGILIFIFLPATLFVVFEGWDYALAVYYAFVTLTTIGFGDYVAGITDKGYGVFFIMYKIFLIVWITFGLGYLVMVVGFLTQGLKSKKVKKLERIVAHNLKQTQSKIWNNVTKDIGYMRRILNEVYMMRFKPVYHDEVPSARVHRSSSCPSLTFMKEESPKPARRRANSEALPIPKIELQRIQSDTDLLAIDKSKTFGVSSMVQPAELLARVVNALGNLQNEKNNLIEEEDGIHGFSDEEILASEKNRSNWSIGGEKMYAVPPKVPRERAASEVKFPNPSQMDKFYSSNEWTWSSPAASSKLKELMAARKIGKLSVPNVSASMGSGLGDPETGRQGKSLISKLNPFKRQTNKLANSNDQIKTSKESIMSPAEYLKKTARGRANSVFEPSRPLRTSMGRTSLSGSQEVLEQTTIADLIRALTALHTSDAACCPKRKLGTASLTPPQMRSSLELLSSSQEALRGKRRFSVHPVQLSLQNEREPSNAHLPPAAARRRFSLHPTSANGVSFTPLQPQMFTSNQPRRGSLFLSTPTTPLPKGSSPGSHLLGRRRLLSTGSRRSSLWAPGGTPNLRTRRPLFPPSIIEGQPARGRRTRHESLTDIRIDDPLSKDI